MSMLATQSNYNDTRCVPDSEAYITALYFTCTSLTTVGFGNVSANTKESLLSHYHCPKEWSQQPFCNYVNKQDAGNKLFFSMKKYLRS